MPDTIPPTRVPSEPAPPPNLLHRLFTNAGALIVRITVYLGSIAALVIAYKHLIAPSKDQPPGITNWMLFVLAGVPLLIAVIETIAGAWRRLKKRRLITGQSLARDSVLGPRTAVDHDGFSLPDDAHRTFVQWVRAAPHPVLHLNKSYTQ